MAARSEGAATRTPSDATRRWYVALRPAWPYRHVAAELGSVRTLNTLHCQAAACQRLVNWHTPYTRGPRGHCARLLPTKNRPRAAHTLRTPFVASAHRSGCKNLWNQNGTPDAVFRTRCHRTLYETDNALLESMAAPYVFGPRLVSAPGAATVFLRSVQLAYSSSQPWASPEPESVSWVSSPPPFGQPVVGTA